MLRTFLLFLLTATAELVGCYLPYRWLRQGGPAWLLVPAAASLALFAWLLSLPVGLAGRTYAAYGGVYIGASLVWLWVVNGETPDRWDALGAGLCALGAAVILFAPRGR